MTEVRLDESQTMTHMWHLMKEVEYLKTQLKPQDTGNLHTAINVIENRILDILKNDKV